MTILGYSGRGRGRGGGRGRGRGWGRGGGAGRSGPYRGRGRGRGRFAFPQHQHHHHHHPPSVGNSSRKWVRKDEPDDIEGNNDSKDEKSKQENSFEKHGKNQLVLKVDDDAVEKPSHLNPEKLGETLTNSLKSEDKIDSGTNETPQLVNKEKETAPKEQLASGSIDDASSDTKSDVQPLGTTVSTMGNASGALGTGNKETSVQLTKVASNKLVAPGARLVPLVPAGRPSHQHHHVPRLHAKRKRPPPARKPHPPRSKRIAIEVLAQTKSSDSHEDSTDPDAITNGESSFEQTEKLTDFAYRETSRRRQHDTNKSKSLKWSANGGNNSNISSSAKASLQQQQQSHQRPIRRNMGLVRVQPNMDKTPICKKFLRGIVCTDQYCKKRHDVPKEFAMPICSFFQRHGNCLKGDDCPFRHIKVNTRAMVCPSFAMLGFCDDPECKMKHERFMPKNKK